MIRIPLLLFLAVSVFTGCSAFQSPNASLGEPGTASVTNGDWQVRARGKFLDEGRVKVQIDMEIKEIGDPTRTIAAPTIVTLVGEDAVITVTGNGADVTCSVSTVRDDSRVIVTVASVISRGGRAVSRPKLRFPID